MIKVGGVVDERRRAPISPRVGLLMYVKPQGEGAPPSGGELTTLWSTAHICRKNPISNLAFIYTCVEILIFLY